MALAENERHSYLNRNPAVFHSNFAELTKSTCMACHQPGSAGESCQLCHNYHTGDLQTLRAPESDFNRPVKPKPAGAGTRLK